MPGLRIFRGIDEAAGHFSPCALTIGNFDGVHLGHLQIFRRVVEVGKAHGWKPSVLTFDPHPARVVAPSRAPLLLSTHEQRARWMESAGIEQLLILPFDYAFSQLGPEQFVLYVLVGKLDARAVIVGCNFRFGHKHAGDTRLLEELGHRHGLYTEALPPVTCRGLTISSSEVRRLILAGDVTRATRLLGRAYALEGTVVPGHGVGSKQTVPTLNLATTAEVLPAPGVYVTRAGDLDDGRRWPAVTNIGCRPTFGGDTLSIETFLMTPLTGPPPVRLRVEFLRRLREERKFENPESLKTQILRDVGRSMAYHRRLDKWAPRLVSG
jgi:riboflavin kinase / FMN adenylyltransferase